MSSGERKAGYPNSGIGKMQASYGMTHSELEELRRQQKAGKVAMVAAIPGRKGQSKDDPYLIPKVEFLYFYHLEVEVPHFDQSSGERLDKGPTVITLHEAAYAKALKVNQFNGKRVTILHDPEMAQESKVAPTTKEPSITQKINAMKREQLEELAKQKEYPAEGWEALNVGDFKKYLIENLTAE